MNSDNQWGVCEFSTGETKVALNDESNTIVEFVSEGDREAVLDIVAAHNALAG